MTSDLPIDWTPEQERVFRAVYEAAIGKQGFIKHPQGPMLNAEHWYTVVYNMAQLAADALEPDTTVVLLDDTGEKLTTFFEESGPRH